VPFCRCTCKTAERYLRKGYAKLIGDKQIKFIVGYVEDKMVEKSGMTIEEMAADEYFMADKNKCCAVCKTEKRLSKHHIVPERHKDKVPPEILSEIANVLIVCWGCHGKYESWFEEHGEPNFDLGNPINWYNHFIEVMKPEHLQGWHIYNKKAR
jgi:hypothetical protein